MTFLQKFQRTLPVIQNCSLHRYVAPIVIRTAKGQIEMSIAEPFRAGQNRWSRPQSLRDCKMNNVSTTNLRSR